MATNLVRPLLLGLVAFAARAPVAIAQQRIARMSLDANGAEVDFGGVDPSLSADGRYVAFASDSSHLVAGDTNGVADVFVKEAATGAIVRVSVASDGSEADYPSTTPSLSDDGRFVAFASFATNLVSGDQNQLQDVFLHDRDPDGNGVFDEGNGTTIRVSLSDQASLEGDGESFWPQVSGDGSRVVFSSDADNLVSGDHNFRRDVFVREPATGSTWRVDVSTQGYEANLVSYHSSISRNGNRVAFSSLASNLVGFDTNGSVDVFVRDLAKGVTRRASVDSAGNEGNAASGFNGCAISGDGDRVVFVSGATNLVAGDTNFHVDVFVHDFKTDTTTRVDVGPGGIEADGDASAAAISGDGSHVVFTTRAGDLGPHDVNGMDDVYVVDLASGATLLASADCTGSGADFGGLQAALGDDGSLVTFASYSDDLVDADTNQWTDVFLLDSTVPPPLATATNYGAGFAGSLTVPTLTAVAPPTFGARLELDVSDSSAQTSVAFVAVGVARASIPTHGGTLLVVPLLVVPYGIPPAGVSIFYDVPYDPSYCGLAIDLQAIEIDPGAAFGLSFTDGLELVFGQ
jgi:Tol biopolymer transport system component